MMVFCLRFGCLGLRNLQKKRKWCHVFLGFDHVGDGADFVKIYLRVLSFFYLIGALLHLADVLGLRLQLSQMSMTWRVWIWYLLVFDFLAFVGLWRLKPWGEILFLTIASSQLIAYIGFQKIFGNQTELVVFHVVTLLIYAFLKARRKLEPT